MVIPKTAKSLISNTFFQLVAKFVTMIITLGATYLITRIYSKSGYGDFNLMQNFPAIFFVIVDFGLNAIATKEVTARPENTQKWFSNIFWFRTFFAALLVLMLWVSLYFFPYSDELRLGIQWGLLIIITQSFTNSFSVIYQSRLRYNLASIGSIIGGFVTLVFIAFFAYYRFPIGFVNFSYILGGVGVLLFNLTRLKKLNISLETQIDVSFIKSIFIKSLPLGLMFVFSQINFKADSILLSILNVPDYLTMSNSEVVASYGLPYKIFEVLLVVPTFYMNSLYPLLVLKLQENSTAFIGFFIKNLASLFGLGIVVGIVGYFGSGTLIDLLGGLEFKESIVVGQILFTFIFVFFVTQPLAWLLVLLDREKLLPLIYLVSAVFNVSANYFFIPKHSFYASATITVLSESLILVLLLIAVISAWRKKYA